MKLGEVFKDYERSQQLEEKINAERDKLTAGIKEPEIHE